MTSAGEAELRALESQLWAIEGARRLTLAMLAFMIYEYVITFDKEIKYFWSGEWTTSRILYLCNRYLPFGPITLGVYCFYKPHLSVEFCEGAIKSVFLATAVNMAVIQSILVMRIWYLFRSAAARFLCVSFFIASTTATFAVMGVSFRSVGRATPIPGLELLGCSVPPPSGIWHIFVPSFVLHTALFVFTAARAFIAGKSIEKTPVMKRLLLDGGIFYFVVFVSVGFSGIGAMLTDVPSINIPAIYSNIMLATTSVSISRVMLSIQTLAAALSTDPAWLLNHAELTRVDIKRGPDGAYHVEIDAVEGHDVEMAPRVPPNPTKVDLKARHESAATTAESGVSPKLPEVDVGDSDYYGDVVSLGYSSGSRRDTTYLSLTPSALKEKEAEVETRPRRLSKPWAPSSSHVRGQRSDSAWFD